MTEVPERPIAPLPEAPAAETVATPVAPPLAEPAAKPAEKEKVKEVGGPKGPEPTRYGDWERKGRCVDF